MAFKDHLDKIIKNADGAVQCSVMGIDGVIVESSANAANQAVSDKTDLPIAFIEYASVVSQIKAQAQALKTGAFQELMLSSENLITLVRMLTEEYYVVLGLRPEGNIGKARYLMRIALPDLKSEL